jgi:hypothetical protein
MHVIAQLRRQSRFQPERKIAARAAPSPSKVSSAVW